MEEFKGHGQTQTKKLRWHYFSQGARSAMRLVAPYQGGF
jgi:hypothetical protein